MGAYSRAARRSPVHLTPAAGCAKLDPAEAHFSGILVKLTGVEILRACCKSLVDRAAVRLVAMTVVLAG